MSAGRWGVAAIAAVVAVAVLAPGGGVGTAPACAQAPARGGPAVHVTPRGWRFAWPKGDPGRGRDVFVRFECYACHAVRGESFPAAGDAASAGPELSAMGAHHPPEYFAESIIDPNAVIERGKGYESADGSSKMPSYADVMTVGEAVDLVAYLTSLRPPDSRAPAGRPPASRGRASPPAGGSRGHSTH